MALHRTHGYDMVLEFSEAGLNTALEPELYNLPQVTFDLPASAVGPIAYRWQAVPTDSTVDLNTTLENGVGLDLAYIMNPETAEGEEGFTGRVRIAHPLSVQEIGATRRCIVLDFTTGVPVGNIEVDFDGSLPPPLDGHEPAVRDAMAEMLSTYLEDEVGLLETSNLCFEIDPEGSDPLFPAAVDLTVVGDDGGCLVLLITTGGGEAGDRSAFTDCAIATRPEAQVLLMLGNDLLLQRLVCPRFLDLIGLTGSAEDFFDFADTEATLREPVPIDHLVTDDRVDEADLESLRFTIEDGGVTVVGGVSLSGTGWTCTVPLEGSVMVGVNAAGAPEISIQVVPGTPDVRIEGWVWALGTLGGSIILGIIGGVVVAVTLALIDDVVEESLAGALAGLFPAIPGPLFPPWPVEIDEIFLDDLAIYGRPSFSEGPPVHVGPAAWIDGELEVADVQGTGTTHRTFMGVVETIHTTFEKAHYGAFRARHRQLVAPLTYYWFLDGQPLEGDGTVGVDDAEIRFSVGGDSCELWAEMGDSLDADLEVTIEDDRDTTVEANRRLTVEGGSDSMGVSGEEVLMGPLMELFQKSPQRIVDTMTALGNFLQWGTRPDEARQPEAVSRVARSGAFREALSKGMDMDLSDHPFHD